MTTARAPRIDISYFMMAKSIWNVFPYLSSIQATRNWFEMYILLLIFSCVDNL